MVIGVTLEDRIKAAVAEGFDYKPDDGTIECYDQLMGLRLRGFEWFLANRDKK